MLNNKELKYWYKNGKVQSWRREVMVLLVMSIAFFLMLALYSYHSVDQSWFYYSTDDSARHGNMCGPVGANIAALLVYLLGAGSVWVVGLFIFFAYLLAVRRTWREEWERVAAWGVLMIATAGLCAAHGIVFMDDLFPGGHIGMLLYAFANQWFGHSGAMLGIYTVLYAAGIILLRFSCIGPVIVLWSLVRRGAVWVWEHKYAQYVGTQVCVLGKYMGMLFVMIKNKCVEAVGWLFGCVSFSGAALTDSEELELLDVTDFSDLFATMDGDERASNEGQTQFQGQRDGMDRVDFVGDGTTSSITDTAGDAFNYDNQMRAREGGSWDASEHHVGHVNEEGLPGSGESVALNENDVQQLSRQSRSGDQAQKSKLDVAAAQVSEQVPVVKNYLLPNLDIFLGADHERARMRDKSRSDETVKKELEARALILQEKLRRFNIEGEVVCIKRGPVVTLFEYKPSIDTKLSKIIALEDDLAMALCAYSIRILAPIPGKEVVGFEVANTQRTDVLFADTIKSSEYCGAAYDLPLVLGQDTIGNHVVVDLARMPHLLIAGSTGSGKSVALNAMLMSLLCSRTPDELKLILIDPKRLEFGTYADIAHLLFPIVVDTKLAAPILQWVVRQMEARYERMAVCGVRNSADYNKLAKKGDAYEPMPFIVVVIDELADLMMTAGNQVEDLIARLAQMARAAGIHLLVATQRPSVDVITGLIKVNFPSRISFRVVSRVDSRTILDCMGAEKLLGRGDMLFLDSTRAILKRVHGAYVSDKEIEQIVGHIRTERAPEYLDIKLDASSGAHMDQMDGDQQKLFVEVVEFLQQKEVDAVSISLLQRKFKIGFNRSAAIIEMLEAQGLIMPANGEKKRMVIK